MSNEERNETMQEKVAPSQIRDIETPSAYVSQSQQEAKDLFHIVCEDVFKIYKIADLEVVALRGLDLRVRRGELMAVVGSSGWGSQHCSMCLRGWICPVPAPRMSTA